MSGPRGGSRASFLFLDGHARRKRYQ
ncbi:MAG: hypothetical protein EHM89_15040 [Acidobacteria bacterium]|nr:MAG: hypothetical protein EHM89_15040 [Acidobacteriota bacterium]